ncbi:MAG: hypothetical protein ACRC75_08190 [Olsenella sp.]
MTDTQDRTVEALTMALLDAQEQHRKVEALTMALLDAQEQHRKDAATIDYIIKTLGDDDPKVGGTDE